MPSPYEESSPGRLQQHGSRFVPAYDRSVAAGDGGAAALGVVCAFLLLLVGAAAVLANQYHYFPGDLAAARAVQSIQAPGFPILMDAITALGGTITAAAIVLLTAIVLFVARQRWAALFTLATLSAPATTQTVKDIVARPRPDAALVHVVRPVTENGFPSGHVLFFTVFFGFVFYVAWTQFRPSIGRAVLLVLCAACIGLVGVSRVYLGAHWPSDVLAGYVIGFLQLVVLVCLYNAARRRLGGQR